MTIREWLKRFYPESAHELHDRSQRDDLSDRADDLLRLNHCIRKWRGILEATRQPKGSRLLSKIYSNYYSAASCALCLKHLDGGCRTCPIVLSGEIACIRKGSVFDIENKAERTTKILRLLRQVKRFVEKAKRYP